MRKLNILKYAVLWLFLVLVCMNSIPSTLAIYRETKNKTLTISIKSPKYTISFDANGGTGSMDDQEFTYGVSQALTSNTFTNSGYSFTGWNTAEDGTGTAYTNGQSISNLSSVDGDTITLYAQWVNDNYVAKIGANQYFTSLQSAVSSVDDDGVEVTITLLKNTTENITVNAGQNIRFNFQNFKLNNTNVNSLIKNYGTIKISNGTLTNTSSATNALIDNYSTGVIEITGGTITSLGTKQAVYNEGGIVRISGNVEISSKAKGTYSNVERATVQNINNGTIYITGGSIYNSEASALSINTGMINIGVKDGDSDASTVLIRGKTYGIYNYTTFNFYDGTLQGKTDSIYKRANFNETEVDHSFKFEKVAVQIDGSSVNYEQATLAMGYTITFNPMQGVVDEAVRAVEANDTIGELPIPRRKYYFFDGWFTEGGDLVTENTIVTSSIELFAHWHQEPVASINGTEYLTLQSAIDTVATNNQETEITILTSFSESVTINANKNIKLVLGNYTITGFIDGNAVPVFTNKGKLSISSGNIVQNAVAAAINNENNGEFVMTGGSITSTGERAAVYNINNGKASISGNSTLTSNASGTYKYNNVNIDRGTIMNMNNTTETIITGGNIICTKSYAISNVGTITLGVKDDGIINAVDPMIRGKGYGIKNTNIFNYYDGIIKGINDAVNGSISDQQTQNIINGTEQIDDNTYRTIHLE